MYDENIYSQQTLEALYGAVPPNLSVSLKILLFEISYTLSDVMMIVDLTFFIFLTHSKTFKVPDILVSNVFFG